MRVLLDHLGSDRDTDPPRDEYPPARSYLVCSTPRSGSGLLCRGLAGAGIAGTPLEYFNPLHRGRLSDRWGCGPGLDNYVRALYALRTTAAGVFGAKLHWDQFVALRAEALGLPLSEPAYELPADFLERLLPRLTYVRIVRRDVDRQAISLWFALHSGTWSLAASERTDTPERADVPYSYEGIDGCRRLIENAELHWDRFVRFNTIRPVEVVYEDLAARYAPTLEHVLRALVPDGDGRPVVATPTSRRLSDGRSEEFLERLTRDREARGVPDPLRLVPGVLPQ